MLEGHTDWVRDVAWAPNIGLPRSYTVTASQDKLDQGYANLTVGQDDSLPIRLCRFCTHKRRWACGKRKIPGCRLEGSVEFGGEHTGCELWRWQGDALD